MVLSTYDLFDKARGGKRFMINAGNESQATAGYQSSRVCFIIMKDYLGRTGIYLLVDY